MNPCLPLLIAVCCRDAQLGLATAAEVQQRYAGMPASLRGALLPFQQQGVLYGLARQGRVLIADEMGVGKTVQALALAACYQVLLVAALS
jgi:SNF2 family DNA or RNA helicase